MKNKFKDFLLFYNMNERVESYFNDVSILIPGITQEIFIEKCRIMMGLLNRKFSSWTMRYFFYPNNPVEEYTLYEFERIFIDIFPNFYWTIQKNMVENLNTFADMNNWGNNEISEMQQLVISNYIPLNNDTETPHESTPTTANTKMKYIDFLKYYNSISMVSNRLYDAIYQEFMCLFKTVYI